MVQLCVLLKPLRLSRDDIIAPPWRIDDRVAPLLRIDDIIATSWRIDGIIAPPLRIDGFEGFLVKRPQLVG